MTTYALPIDMQNQTDEPPSTVNGWQPMPIPEQRDTQDLAFPEQRENWQIVPPIITEGRIATVNSQNAALQEKYRQAPLSQDATTLFKISFTGLDQQHYSVRATVKQPLNQVSVRREHVTPREPALRIPAQDMPAQPLLHPAWQTAVSPAEAPGEEWSASAARPALTPSAWQEAPSIERSTLGRPNVRSSEREAPIALEQAKKEDKDKDFLLQVIQPSLVGLMDGSVSTLAPIFAVAFATKSPVTAFLVGMASALGAGISMAFSEAISDDGDLTGRGNPFVRGGITGIMTFISGAGHALPFLIPDLQLALFVAYAVVAIELFVIAAIRHKFFGTSWWLSIVQVVGGGALVFAAAFLLGGG